jgi:DNA-binding transcriptional regulator LsrR (DeoR family)
MLKQNDLRLVVKIATLYYGEGMKQTDIARAQSFAVLCFTGIKSQY